MKLLKILLILLLSNQSFAQKIEGNYIYKSAKNDLSFEIQIRNDSTYVSKYIGNALDCGYSDSKEIGKKGIIKRKGKFYSLIESDDVSKKENELLVKFTASKMIFYGYEPKRSKLVKAFELKRASL